MTNPSHTELAARNLWETIKILGLQNEKLALQAIAAALESPERVQGEANTGRPCKVGGPCVATATSSCACLELPAPTPPTAPAQDAQGVPYAYAVYFPNQQREELVHDTDELLEDMTNDTHTVTELFAALRASSPADTREPLTDEQIEDMHAEANRGMFIERDDYFKAFRDAEFIHGIVTKERT